MKENNNNWAIAEAYLSGNLPESELKLLQHRLETDVPFAVDFQECINMIHSLEGSAKHKRFRTMLVDIQKGSSQQKRIRTIPLSTHYWRTTAVAASIAIITTLSTFWMITHKEKEHTSQYSLLRRELETIKRSQNAIIQNINESKTYVPATPANFSGTGFALTNNGYFVTNYHVTENADSVYIQNLNGEYFKADLVAFNKKSDVAILKVEDKNFRFSKSELPYTFASAKNSLGSRVFTLGYPDDEIVYNEGYISAKNGFLGDSIQYRLEMPANPGQSGAPVIDRRGNIIGIISGKDNEMEGTTYAVSSKAIYDVVKTLPVDISLPKTNKLNKLNREQQVEKLEYFTCSVKVYKK